MPNSPYTSQSISGYNSSPPSDDGSQTEANRVKWSTIKTKLADAIKTLSENINSALVTAFAKVINTDADENNALAGSLAFTSSTLTIASGSVTATRSNHIIAAETGTTDALTNIAGGSVSTNCFLWITADAGDTITVTDTAGGAGQIKTADNANIALSGDMALLLEYDGTDWLERARSIDGITLTNLTGIGAADFTSSEQTVTVDTVLNVAHSLSAIPKLYTVSLRCKSTEAGFAADDEIFYMGITGGSADQGVTTNADATNITIVQGSGMTVLSQSTLNSVTLTPANFKWVVRAWL